MKLTTRIKRIAKKPDWSKIFWVILTIAIIITTFLPAVFIIIQNL